MKTPSKTTVEIERANNLYQTYTKIEEDKDFYSKLKLIHQKQENGDYLSINASLYRGLLTKSFLCYCLAEMQPGLIAEQITSLKLVGLTNKNAEAEIFRKSNVRSIQDGAFSNLREVVIESGYPQDMPEEIQSTTTLPSKPFMRADLDFLKIDGKQVIPDNFLANANRVGMLICPDNQNTHEFLSSPNLDNVFSLSATLDDTTQNCQE